MSSPIYRGLSEQPPLHRRFPALLRTGVVCQLWNVTRARVPPWQLDARCDCSGRDRVGPGSLSAPKVTESRGKAQCKRSRVRESVVSDFGGKLCSVLE